MKGPARKQNRRRKRFFTCRMVKFSRTLFIMYFSGRCFSLWMKLIIYSHMGDRWIRYTHLPFSIRANSVCRKTCRDLVKLSMLNLRTPTQNGLSVRSPQRNHGTHLHLFNNLFSKGAHFSGDCDGHVFSTAILTAYTIKSTRTILYSAVQIRLEQSKRFMQIKHGLE